MVRERKPGSWRVWLLLAMVVTGACGSSSSGPPPMCGHPPCMVGGPLAASCDTCVQKICAANPNCCSTQWAQACIDLIPICPKRCDCSQALTVGAPFFKDACDCTKKVCAAHPTCCSTSWTGDCVTSVNQLYPDGGCVDGGAG